MPLEHGTSRAAFSHNVAELIRAGHPRAHALAAAYRERRESRDEDISAPSGAGTLLLSEKGNALFLRRGTRGDHQQEWCFPGGTIEDGEMPEQAARRETQEETGRGGDDPLTELDSNAGFVTYGQTVEEFAPTLNEEHTQYQWAPMDAPPQPLHPGVAATLTRLLERAINAGERESAAERASEAAGKEEAEAQREAAALLAGAQDRREWDSNGWFEVKDNPLSRIGVFKYSEASVKKGGDRNKMVNVFLPPEELGSEEAVRSFRLLPWTDDHPDALLGDESQGLVPAEKKGIQGVIGEDVYFKDGVLYGNIKVFSESLARKIASGKRELSCGYRCNFVPQAGVYNGERYEYVQKVVRGNHTASVDRGRRGPEMRVLDAAEMSHDSYFTFSLDMIDEVRVTEKRKDETEGTVDAETTELVKSHISDSWNSLVSKLESKGYSKHYAEGVAGKVWKEQQGKDAPEPKRESTSVADKSGGEVKDPSGGKEEPKKDGDLEPKGPGEGGSKDARDARDTKRSARDARRAKDMTEEEEEAEDAAESAEDAEEEKEDEKDESKEAKDRRSARDRRAGARDARRVARDRRAAKDTKKGMDAAEITALVDRRVAEAAGKAATGATAEARRDAVAAQKLYQKVSPIVGAFDHDEMTHTEMAAYALKKLGRPEFGDPVTALDCFLAGRASAPAPTHRGAHDSASGESFVTKYLAS